MEEIPLHFRIDSIRVLGFVQREPEKPVGSGEEHAVNVGVSVQADKDNNKIGVTIRSDVRLTSDPASPILIELVTGMGFLFQKGELFDVDKEAAIPKVVLDQLVSIAYSTTRGILFTKVGHSSLSNLILPLLDVRDLTAQVKPAEQAENDDTPD